MWTRFLWQKDFKVYSLMHGFKPVVEDKIKVDTMRRFDDFVGAWRNYVSVEDFKRTMVARLKLFKVRKNPSLGLF